MNNTFDIGIIGAGIIGLTIGAELIKRYPALSIVILEKENQAGIHASGRNSGVMHCGIYYAKDSLKAKACAAGRQHMIDFAKQSGISVKEQGKVIVATDETERLTLQKLYDNALSNQIPVQQLDEKELQEKEPYAAKGTGAIFCPTTAVIDPKQVLIKLQSQLEKQGVTFLFNCAVIKLNKYNRLLTTQGYIDCAYFFNCAGAHADTVAKLFGLAEQYQLLPFKGLYWKLKPSAQHKVNANIYPVPDLNMPFLGVHFTRTIDSQVYIGPTAIPVFGRENYRRFQGIHFRESLSISYQLFQLYWQNTHHFRNVVHREFKKYHAFHFMQSARKLVPTLCKEDMEPSPKTGIRAQLVNTKNHQLELDFILEQTENSLHILNAISPAFTSAFALAKMIVDKAALALP